MFSFQASVVVFVRVLSGVAVSGGCVFKVVQCFASMAMYTCVQLCANYMICLVL